MKELCRDIYDLYAEYEDEDEEDGCPGSPSQLLLPPTKHLTLNINVGGTVSDIAAFFFLQHKNNPTEVKVNIKLGTNRRHR